jgi:hypothetical protein
MHDTSYSKDETAGASAIDCSMEFHLATLCNGKTIDDFHWVNVDTHIVVSNIHTSLSAGGSFCSFVSRYQTRYCTGTIRKMTGARQPGTSNLCKTYVKNILRDVPWYCLVRVP